MIITICDRGCGRTSLDSDSDIRKMTVAIRVNGADPAPANALELDNVCRPCRDSIIQMISTRMLPVSIPNVKVLKGSPKEE